MTTDNADTDAQLTPHHLLEDAWGLIANAGDGDWNREGAEWKAAAERWRDSYEANQRGNDRPESNLIGHARRELALLGEDDQAFVDSLLAAVRGFCSYGGHSGGSAEIAVDHLMRLLRYQALTSLTNDPAEWTDRTEMSGYPLWQNTRDSRAMSEDGGRTYWLVDQVPQDSDSSTAPRYIAAEPGVRTRGEG